MLHATLLCLLHCVTQSDLIGTVIDEAGSPVEDAIVVVAGINPSQPSGQDTLVGTTLATNESGEFTLENALPDATYKLWIGKPSFDGQTAYLSHDPEADRKLRLPRTPPSLTNEISGIVVDETGEPLPSVILYPRMIQYGRTISGRNDKLVTTLVLSDSKGRFQLKSDPRVSGFGLRAQVQSKAMAEVQVSASSAELTVQMNRGASIRGRLVSKGTSIAGVKMGLVQKDKTMGNIVSPMETTTDSDGVFVFDHIPANREYAVYSLINQGAECALPVSIVSAPESGKRAELGDIDTQAPRKISVQIQLRDKQPLPEKSIVYVSRNTAWQSARFDVAGKTNPTIEVTDAANETFLIRVRVPGFKILRTVPLKSEGINQDYAVNVASDTNIAFFLVRETEK